MEQVQQNKNILWVDIAKFIAMFLVVFEHVVLAFKLKDTAYIGYIRNIVVTFHMTIFFIIGGYLYKQRSKLDNYSKILWSLVIPYFIYQFLYLPFKLGYYIGVEHIPATIASIKCFVGILLGDNLGTEGSKYALSVCPALWFLMVMIQLRFIFANLNLTKRNLLLVSLIAFSILKVLNIFHIDLYFCLDNTLYAIPYFALGYYLKNNIKVVKLGTSKRIILFDVVLLCLMFQIVFLLRLHHSNILLLQYCCGIFGFLAVARFSQLFSKTNNFVNTIAKNTLFLIFFQSLFLFITKWVKLYNIIPMISHHYMQLIFVVAYSGLIYIVSYYVILLLQKLKLDIVLGKYKRGQQV